MCSETRFTYTTENKWGSGILLASSELQVWAVLYEGSAPNFISKLANEVKIFFLFSNECCCQEGVCCHSYFIENIEKLLSILMEKKKKLKKLKLNWNLMLWPCLLYSCNIIYIRLPGAFHTKMPTKHCSGHIWVILKISQEFTWEVKSQILHPHRKISIKMQLIFRVSFFR